MMSEKMQKRYSEAFDSFQKEFQGKNGILVEHRSIKKFENKTNQDISFKKGDEYLFGIYVAADLYKIYTDNEKWAEKSDFTDEQDETGWWRIRRDTLEETIEEIRFGLKTGWGIEIA